MGGGCAQTTFRLSWPYLCSPRPSAPACSSLPSPPEPARSRCIRRVPSPPRPARVPAQPQYAPPHQFYRGQGPHNGDWLRNTMQLPPQERQRRLEQDPRFRQLPPQRQQELLHRLQAFDAMPPQEQQRVLNRMEMIEHLPPEQQRRAQALFERVPHPGPAAQTDDAPAPCARCEPCLPTPACTSWVPPRSARRYSPEEVRMLYDFNSIGFVGPEQ